MKALVALLILLQAALGAEPIKVRFALPESLPLVVSLVLPEEGSVTLHQKTEHGDSIQAVVGYKGEPGMVVEISDLKGRKLWSHDFGFNLSAPQGCTVEVGYNPASRLLLAHYRGYKFDHHHKLLFVEMDGGSPTVREYSTAQRDILPLLKRQAGFASDYKYSISPIVSVGHRVEFECIPSRKPESPGSSPFAQDKNWYRVIATIDVNRTIRPVEVKVNHEGW